MKRVKAACIMQTLVFLQKEELGLSAAQALVLNRQEVEHYKETLERGRIRHEILKTEEKSDGSIVLHVKKQYNDRVPTDEYFA